MRGLRLVIVAIYAPMVAMAWALFLLVVGLYRLHAGRSRVRRLSRQEWKAGERAFHSQMDADIELMIRTGMTPSELARSRT